MFSIESGEWSGVRTLLLLYISSLCKLILKTKKKKKPKEKGVVKHEVLGLRSFPSRSLVSLSTSATKRTQKQTTGSHSSPTGRATPLLRRQPIFFF
jgi:hypothetical protein